MLSPLTNTLTCRRRVPCSSRTRWPTPGWAWPRAASTLPTVAPATSRWRRPPLWPASAEGRWTVGIDRPSGHDGGLDADHRGQPPGQGLPVLALVGRGVQLAGAGPEVQAGRVEPVGPEPVAKHRQPGVALGQPVAEGLPGGPGVAGPVDAGPAVGGAA